MLSTLLLATQLVALPTPHGCMTPQLMRERPVPQRPLLSAPLLKQSTKSERDAFAVPNSLTSANFAVRWGNSTTLTAVDAQAIIDLFEVAWAVEVDTMRHPAPWGSDTTLFNVYVGDSGDGAPSALGAGGYFWFDDEGWPMIVISQTAVDDLDYFGATVVAHEFYHAVQDATRRFAYDGISAWFLEASAEWITGEVFPDNTAYGVFVFGYVMQPQLPVHFFDYADTGAFTEYHQYGAFLFLRHLSEHIGDWRLIRDAWTDTGTTPDPLVVLNDLLTAHDSDMAQAFASFPTFNAVWDYTHGVAFEMNTEWNAAWYPDYDRRLAGTLSGTGDGSWQRIAGSDAPQQYGYNLIHWRSPASGLLTIRFGGDASGSLSSTPTFDVNLVRVFTDGYEVVPVVVNGLAGELIDVATTGERELFITIAARSDQLHADESFPYAYFATITTPTTEPRPEPDDGWGCSSSATGPWLLLGLLILPLRRRRRATTTAA